MGDASVLLLDQDGWEIDELPVTAVSNAGLQLNQAGEMTVQVALSSRPNLLDTVRRWTTQMLLVIDGTPTLGGYVAKRRAPADTGTLEVTVKEWSSWFDRVWFPADHPLADYPQIGDPDTADAADVIATRVTRAIDPTQGLTVGYLRPPLWDLGVTPAGLPIEIEFAPAESNPASLGDDIRQVIDFGVDVSWPWREKEPGRWLPGLRVTRYDPADPDTELLLGWDSTTASLVEDTDAQVNRWEVVGVDATDVVVAQVNDPTSPPLFATRSWEKFEDPTLNNDRLRAAAQALVAATSASPFSVDDIRIPTLQAGFPLGTGLHVVIPPGVDSRIPAGAEVTVRVVGVQWELSANGASTTLQCAAELDSARPRTGGQVAGLARRNVVAHLTHLTRTVNRLAARR